MRIIMAQGVEIAKRLKSGLALATAVMLPLLISACEHSHIHMPH